MQVLLLKMDNEEDEKGYKKVQFTHFLTYFLARMERKLEQYCKIKFKFVVDKLTSLQECELTSLQVSGRSHLFTFSPLKGEAIFSPFHLFTFKRHLASP